MTDAEEDPAAAPLAADPAGTNGKVPQSLRPGGKKRKVALYIAFVGAGYSVRHLPFWLTSTPFTTRATLQSQLLPCSPGRRGPARHASYAMLPDVINLLMVVVASSSAVHVGCAGHAAQPGHAHH